ncbi:MAG: ABC transporter ATP-binding protein [Rikenellaceae bacterium]|nr:ABC transporter ATP-binding protein [Rikenellaceae bacterium]
MNNPTTIQLLQTGFGYDGRTLVHSTTDFVQGELCALIGRNGTGKSTLLRALAGITHPTEGKVLVNGTNIHRISSVRLAELVSFVSTERIAVTNLKVRDVVALGRTPYTNWLGSLSRNDNEIIERAMERMGVASFAQKQIATLSDGENARVMIARALAQQTPVILLDEPTAFLDIAGKYELCETLRDLAAEGKTIIFSSHDLATALATNCSIALIYNGELHHGTAEQMRSSSALASFFNESGFSMDYSSGVLRRIK